MREPRHGIAWSRGRVARRERYSQFMASAAWRRRRAAWYAAHLSTTGERPSCAICNSCWRLGVDDLHHRSYDRLGAGRDEDLVPLCRSCHDTVHEVIESSPAWRRMSRAQATDVVIARLRRRHREESR